MRAWPMILTLQLLGGVAAAQGDPAAGRRLAEANCATCHAIGPGRSAPAVRGATPFVEVARMPSTTTLSLAAFLRTPHARMPDIVLSGEDLDDVVAYILSLRGEAR